MNRDELIALAKTVAAGGIPGSCSTAAKNLARAFLEADAEREQFRAELQGWDDEIALKSTALKGVCAERDAALAEVERLKANVRAGDELCHGLACDNLALRAELSALRAEIDAAPVVVCCDMHEGKACGMWSAPAPWNKDANTRARLVRIEKRED